MIEFYSNFNIKFAESRNCFDLGPQRQTFVRCNWESDSRRMDFLSGGFPPTSQPAQSPRSHPTAKAR
jgi:hypothetical protein